MPIRIMHIVDNLGMGGLQNGIANLIDRLDPVRFEHVLCAMRPVEDIHAQPFPANRARLMCLSEQETDSRIQVPALVRRIRRVQPDIVHSRNWAAIEAMIAGRWVRSCALVHSEHGIDTATTAVEPWHRSRFRRLAFELADRVLSVSYQLRSLHATRTGFPVDSISVIHNGVDTRRFSPDARARTRVREELGLRDNALCIGCVGNLTTVKDHLTVLRAVAEFSRSCEDWHLLLIGEGPERTNLEAFIEAHPESKKRVSFLGRSKRVPELLNAMDVYVLSSVSEGICNSLLEAMATGLPCIATDTGGNPELVLDKTSGLLFPVGNVQKLTEELLLLQSQKDLRLEFGHQAMRRAHEHFSIDSMIQKYEQVYESLAPVDAPVRSAVGA